MLLGAIAGILKLAVKMNVLSTQMARIHFFNKPAQCANFSLWKDKFLYFFFAIVK